MGKAIKQTILVLMIMLGLTLLPAFTMKVHASGLDTKAIETDADSTNQQTGEGLSGGPCREKTAFLVSVTYASGLNGSPTQMGHASVLKAKGGYEMKPFSLSDSKLPIGGGASAGTAPWPQPGWMQAGKNPCGYGKAIAGWLASETSTGDSRAAKVAELYCGVSEDEILQKINDGYDVFLNVEGLMWCNSFTSTSSSSRGGIIAGTVYSIGNSISDDKTCISSVTRGAFPKGGYYDKDWQGISAVSPPAGNGTISTGEMMNKSLGWGIVSLHLNQDYQVVIVCHDLTDDSYETTYMGSGKNYTIQDPWHHLNNGQR